MPSLLGAYVSSVAEKSSRATALGLHALAGTTLATSLTPGLGPVLAEAYKDVVPEGAIEIGGATKARDHSFRVGGVRKFFVEAKRPAVRLEDDAAFGVPTAPSDGTEVRYLVG